MGASLHSPAMKKASTLPPKRKGLSRLLHALTYSWDGLAVGWREPAFRQELLAAIVLIPAAFFIAQEWTERVILIACVVFVLVVELLNTAVEAVVDRTGLEWNELSKRAKDLGSAAVLLALLLCGGVWVSAIWRWLAA